MASTGFLVCLKSRDRLKQNFLTASTGICVGMEKCKNWLLCFQLPFNFLNLELGKTLRKQNCRRHKRQGLQDHDKHAKNHF